MQLTSEQKADLILSLKSFLKKAVVTNDGKEEDYHSFDKRRAEAIPLIKQTVDAFLGRSIDLKEFKEKSELECRKYPYWGFKNFSGQLQLNLYANNITDPEKDEVLKKALSFPKTEDEALKQIGLLSTYLAKLRNQAENRHSIPWPTQSYLLSYFWELQKPLTWPVYYNSTKKVLLSMGFKLDTFDTPSQEYAEFVKIIKAIWEIYKTEGLSDEAHPYWFVEHVLWHRFITTQSTVQPATAKEKAKRQPETDSLTSGGFEWLPDIIKDLNDLASNKETAWSKRKGLKPEKAFETKLRFAFSLLGYEATELGQGTGREPDGIALSKNISADYGIIYDAKAREDRYRIGTNDREIFEYIQKKRAELRKQRINKAYFVIVSSDFDTDSALPLIRNIYKNTQTPVTLLKASDLLFIIDSKLQDVEIDHARLEDLFIDTGLISRERIIDVFGLR